MYEEITKALLDFKYPKLYTRKNILNEGDKCYEGFVLGKILSWAHKDAAQTGQIITDSKKTNEKKYKDLHQLAKDIITDFEYTTIQFNKNYQCNKHIDGRNIGVSRIIGLGDYEGGELLVYYRGEKEEPTKIDIKNNFYDFNGSMFYHETAPFTGERHTLVFFSR